MYHFVFVWLRVAVLPLFLVPLGQTWWAILCGGQQKPAAPVGFCFLLWSDRSYEAILIDRPACLRDPPATSPKTKAAHTIMGIDSMFVRRTAAMMRACSGATERLCTSAHPFKMVAIATATM